MFNVKEMKTASTVSTGSRFFHWLVVLNIESLCDVIYSRLSTLMSPAALTLLSKLTRLLPFCLVHVRANKSQQFIRM